MSTDLDNIKIKIKKLLAMAAKAEGNENEALVAANMAAKLMVKYQLDHSDMIKVELKKGDGLAGEIINDMEYKAWPVWLQGMVISVVKAFECQVKFVKGNAPGTHQLLIEGYKLDVEMCRWMFGFLYEELMRLANQYVTNRSKTVADFSKVKMKNSFLKGASDAVRERLKQIVVDRESAVAGTGLIVIKKDAIQKRFGNTKYTRKRVTASDAEAFNRGRLKGKAVNLNRPLNETNKNRELL